MIIWQNTLMINQQTATNLFYNQDHDGHCKNKVFLRAHTQLTQEDQMLQFLPKVLEEQGQFFFLFCTKDICV